MTITLAALLAADTAALRAVAGRFEQVARLVDDTVAELSATTRDLPSYYTSGPGAQAARQHDADLRRQLATAYDPVDYSAHIVRDFADSLDEFRRLARSVLSEAEGKGFTIDVDTGRITGPAQPIDPIIGLQAAQSTAGYYAAQLSEIVQRAGQVDTATRARLQDLGTGGLELQTVAPKPTLQYDERVFRESAPESLADWWHRLNPLTREQYAAAYPDAVGAAEGLPSSYRDQANRILLDRRVTQLQAEQQRLTDLHDGAGTPALQRVQIDLAAARRLQQAKGYLVDYRPGDEQHATPSAGGSKWDTLRVN